MFVVDAGHSLNNSFPVRVVLSRGNKKYVKQDVRNS